ncbi:hypothetical protein AGDE_08281 [Angomonas deanei]|uniref:Translin-associated factor X-interacting protein 1 N-terminal domain-containing protein n=1 Tax=Angomonas deanei TaxID=59799 RepID=A0A7G2C947_9TRYP|nr:hypothetical protein AGDE_08281 [Angomonas deanei]CAD2215377.1 hypothetical protein, conserved [Angomonas deanei]|eukprot:EPY33443.1 hypothetical protein AGDE_08281 [Angomonas deanei]
MKLVDLENKSDRSVHAMELMQLKENLNAVISNQQAQLLASQGLVHSLREQVAAAEHANSLLKYELDRHAKEYEEANEKVRLISKAMVEESSRASDIIDTSRKKDREIDLLNAKIKVLSENVEELEGFLRGKAQEEVLGTVDSTLASRNPTMPMKEDHPLFTSDYVSQLEARLDKGCFDDVVRQFNPDAFALHTNVVEKEPSASVSIFNTWLRSEGVIEADLDGEHILPPGLWSSEEFSFLEVCHPVPHRHMTCASVTTLVANFWDDREKERSKGRRIREFFMDWLRTQSGGVEKGRELGLNLLHSCQRFMKEPECRVLLFALRGFLPEVLVSAVRRLIKQLIQMLDSGVERNGDCVSFEDFFSVVRRVFPEKSMTNMLQLRFHVYRLNANEVNIKSLLQPDSYFISMLKNQFALEVEEYTLSIVEGIRRVADVSGNNVLLAKVIDVFHTVDPGMSREGVHNYVADGCQKTLMDIATLDNSATIRLDSLLTRYRTCVLLRRSTPPNM